MKIKYIFNSGFTVETDSCILIFDCWKDPAGVISGILSTDKHVYVFDSHFHEDHFTREILRWRVDYPSVRITYLLSKDILKHRRAAKEDADAWLAKGATWKDEQITVYATGSNDSGVSWIVEVDGKRISLQVILTTGMPDFLLNTIKEELSYRMSLERSILSKMKSGILENSKK